MDLKLNEFPTGDVSFFTVKNSKGLKKQVKIGAELVESTKLTIALNPYESCNTFKLAVSSSGGILIEQSNEGNIILSISSSITLKGLQVEPPTNFISSMVRRRDTNGKWTVDTIYVSI